MAPLKNPICRFAVLGSLLLWSFGALAEHYTIPLLVPATTSGAPQGVLRILNGTDESGTVEIYAINDTGTRSGPATFTLNASVAVEFNATDLQSGNATKGLSGGIGANVGDARLVIETDLRIVPLAFVRAADGTLSAMHDTVRAASVAAAGQYRYDVPIFNPSTDVTQVSRLRLINPGDTAAAVTIEGRDDSGAQASGGSVRLTLAAGGAQTLTAQQLEAGSTGLTGQLGAGVGKWRLSVSADQAIQVVNVVAASAGYSNNLSTTAVPGAAPADHAAFNERFVGVAIESRTDSGVFTLNATTGDRFSESEESDGVTTTYAGSYGYEGIGPDAGRLTLTYDDGDVCAANLYFGSLMAGWFASRCTGSDYPADGYWSGGSWSAEDADDISPPDSTGTATDGECSVGLVVRIGESCTYPGTSDAFTVNDRGRGSFLTFLGGIRIRINSQTIDGRVYDLLASHQGDGVWRIDRVAGSTGAPTGGGTETGSDTSPVLGSGPGNQTYTVDTAIDTLTLSAASGGDGTLSYSLAPAVPGLSFNATTRQLTGTPTTASAYAMTYTVTDDDGDTDTLNFTITVSVFAAGVCEVALERSAGAGGTETVSVALADALETNVGTLDAPFVVRARMDSSSDFDVYKIVLSDAGRLVVLSSGALDTQAVFLRSDCTEAGRVVEDVGVIEGFAANNYNFSLGGDLGPGTYYMVVFEWAKRTGNYALEIGFVSDDGVNDTPVIEPVANQEIAPGGTATVDVQITDDTGDAHAIVAISDNEDVATADLRGSGSSRSLVITVQAAGTATVTLRAVDQEDAVASPVTFDVIVASPMLPAPAFEPGSNAGELEVTFPATFGPMERRAYDYQLRVNRPQTPWLTVGCDTFFNSSSSGATGPAGTTIRGLPVGLTFDGRYRYRNSSSCSTGLPGNWSAVGEGASRGTAANATPAFPEGASTDRSVNENVGGGINVGSPVAASDADGARDVLTYSLGGADAGSFRIVPATGQIRTRDGVTYDHEARNTYSVTVETLDVHSATDRISVDIHIVDLGSVCAAPPRLRLNSGDGGLTVRWTPLADQAGSASVLGYEVERRDGAGGAWGNRQIIGGRATSNTTYTGLVNGRQYDVRVRPYGDEDACDWSAPVSGIPTTDTAPRDQSDFEDRVPPETQLRDWRFPVPGRFSEIGDDRQFDGSYRYARTDANRGTITFEYDEIGQSGCEVSLLFSSLTSGSFLDECEGAGVNVDVNFDIEEPPAPSSPLAPQTMEDFDALVLGQENTLLPGFGFGYVFPARIGTRPGGPASGVVYQTRRLIGGNDPTDNATSIHGRYMYETTGPNSGALTVRFGCRCPRDEWDDNNDTRTEPDEEWVFELSFLSSDAAEYTLTLYREGQEPLTLNGFIDFKSGDNLSSFPPELLPPGSPPQASGNDLFGVDAATGATSLTIDDDSIQTILVQDGGIQDIAYQPGDWLEPKDGGNQRMMIVGPGQTAAPVAAGLVFRAGTPAQANAVPLAAAGQTDLIALSVVCMQFDKGIPPRGSRFFSQSKSPVGAVQTCQRNCVVAGGDSIQRCVWECEGSADGATAVVADIADNAMRQLLDALGASSAGEPIRTGARTRGNDLKSGFLTIE